MLLQIRDLCVDHGRLRAVRGVSLDVSEGAIVCLLGANGAGKSSIMRTISGLQRPSAGQILLHDAPIHHKSVADIVALGIAQVPEGKGLFPKMTVSENLEMGAYFRHDGRQVKADVQEVLEHFPVLLQRRKQRAGTLSGGEQQMLAIACALLAKPRILLLDEPLQGLSPIMAAEIESIVRELNQNGITILMVEHNVGMALEMSHHVYIIESGTVAMHGSPKELSETEYVQRVYLAV